MSHSDADQYGKVKCKTIGKMLDDKVTIEGMFTTVLHALIIDNKFKFLTQNDSIHLAKSPLGMFPEQYIDNDLKKIVQAIGEYFDED